MRSSNQFTLEAMKKRFHKGIICAVIRSIETLLDAMLLQFIAIFIAQIFNAAI
jgi:hypothetical protein